MRQCDSARGQAKMGKPSVARLPTCLREKSYPRLNLINPKKSSEKSYPRLNLINPKKIQLAWSFQSYQKKKWYFLLKFFCSSLRCRSLHDIQITYSLRVPCLTRSQRSKKQDGDDSSQRWPALAVTHRGPPMCAGIEIDVSRQSERWSESEQNLAILPQKAKKTIYPFHSDTTKATFPFHNDTTKPFSRPFSTGTLRHAPFPQEHFVTMYPLKHLGCVTMLCHNDSVQ